MSERRDYVVNAVYDLRATLISARETAAYVADALFDVGDVPGLRREVVPQAIIDALNAVNVAIDELHESDDV